MSKEDKSQEKTRPDPAGGNNPAAAGSAVNGQEASAAEANLRDRAEAAEKKSEEYLDLAKRARADFENYQKRFARDLAEERRYAQRPLAADLLPVIDNLERAMAAAQQAKESGPLVQGVQLALNQFLDVLRRHGITRVDALNRPFDPHLHEAVMQQPTADRPPMAVLQVLENGYVFHDRVLRPARVVVSIAPPSDQK
jgi:molecular chaperone GrpE